MAITVLSKPDAINLAANLTKISLLTTDSVRFILKQGSSTLIDDTYHPNLSNKIEIDVQEVVTHQLQHILSDAAVWQQTELVKTFTAEIPGTTITFSVILGGVSNFADTAANFLRGNFLTWQPQTKDVTYYSPELLTYYSGQNGKIVLKAYFEDGTNKQIDIATLTSGKAYTCNMNYGYVYGLLKKYPMYYDVWVVDSANTRLSFIQRYQASQVKSKHEEWFLFQNSVGGIDTARFYGETDMTNVIESDIAQIDDISIEAEISSERQFAKNTGLLDDYERKWILDFFVSKRKWKLVSGEMRQIVISETDVVASFEEHVNDYTFTYRYADEKPLLNLTRNSGDLPSGITIPVPSGSPAFLSPRLNEFPRLNLSDDILFPIQSPSNEQFAATTWGMIKGILNKLIEDQVSNIKIPDVPETLPPGPHTHPIDDVVQLKTELEKRLLKETFDALFRYDQTLDCLFVTKPIAVQGGVTMFADAGTLDLPSIYDGIPLGDGLAWKDGKIIATGGGGSGTMDHNALSNRNAADQHTIAAITGLQSALDGKSPVHSHPYLSIADAQSNYWHNGNSNLATVDWSAKAFGGEEYRIKGVSVITAGTDWNDFGSSGKKVTIHSSLNPDVTVAGYRYNLWHSGNFNLPTINIVAAEGTFHNGLKTIGNDSGIILGADKGGGATIKYNSDGNLHLIPRSGYNSLFTNGFVKINEHIQCDTYRGTNGAYLMGFDTATKIMGVGSQAANVVNVVKFDTNGAERMRIQSDGRIGVNRSSGISATFDVNGSIRANGGIWSENPSGVTAQGRYLELAKYKGSLPGYQNDYYPTLKTDFSALYFSANNKYTGWIFNSTDGNNVEIGFNARGVSAIRFSNCENSFVNTHGGNLGIGTSEPTSGYKLDVVGNELVRGNILAHGGITMLSDMRLKNRISNAKSVLPYISSIDVFRYSLKADVAKRIYIGVSAQQIQGIWSEFVHGVETLSLDYAQMAAYIAIKGLQETKLWMDSKDKKIAELEKRIVELEINVA